MKAKIGVRYCVIIMTVIQLVILPSSYAGFVDDWLTQKTETSPGYFEGQKRGYLTGGSFSARWQQRNDYLFTFEPPRLKFGCGGVDAFMGGFSFLNMDYLVQKLQRIMQAAPAAAFDMALNTLCPQCSNTIKSLEQLANQLNSLQLEDCKASKALVSIPLDQAMNGASPEIHAEAEKATKLLKGYEDLPQKIVDSWKSTTNKPGLSHTEMTSGCPADVRAVLDDPNKTIFEAIADYRGYPRAYMDIIRGVIGDVYIKESVDPNTGTTTRVPLEIAPCPQNPDGANLMSAIYSGEAYMRPAAGSSEQACIQINDSNANLTLYINDQLQNIVAKMKDRTALTATENSLVDNSPLPLFQALRIAAASGASSNGMIASLSDVTAKSYAAKILMDLFNIISYNVRLVQALASKQLGAYKPDCQADIYIPTVSAVERKLVEVANLMRQVNSDFANSLQETKVIQDIGQKYDKFTEIAHKKLSGSFSPSLAGRALSGGR